jgi:LacI family fructose operon transcriptional repressor
VPHVNIDLPGRYAPLFISDNYQGADAVTTAIIRHAEANGMEGCRAASS